MIPGAVDLRPSCVFVLALDGIAVGTISVSSVAEYLAVSQGVGGNVHFVEAAP